MVDIVGIESPCVDLLLHTESFPLRGGSIPLRAYGRQGGGKVSTGMVAAARLGAKAAAMGRVGNDSLGQFCIDDFMRHGIDCSHMRILPDKTSTLSVVLTDPENRSFLVNHGTCGVLEPQEIDVDFIANARFLYISKLTDCALTACRIAREHGVRVFLDADRPSPELLPSLPLFDYFIASEIIYNSLFQGDAFEENCAAIRRAGPGVVVFTLGDQGVVGLSEEGFFTLPAFRVEVADTTGAGDVFHGALLAALLRSNDLPGCETLAGCARFASAAAAIKCTRYGGRAGIPDLPVLFHFLDTGEIDYTEIDKRVSFYEALL